MDYLVVLVVIMVIFWVISTSANQATQEGEGLAFLINKEKYLHAKMPFTAWRAYYLIANFLFFVGAMGIIYLAFILMERFQLSGVGLFAGIAALLAILFYAISQLIVERLLKLFISRAGTNSRS